ncbi:MAG: hypothetical protein J7L55_02545 [Desulfurococcales archaeon]|nr:hypothetical protein [Desulfurococcales archaeon]
MDEEKRSRSGVKSIRGLDDELYERITLLARETGRTVGELFNEAMKFLLAATGKAADVGRQFVEGCKEVAKPVEGVEVVSGVDELEVSSKDLASVERPVEFRNVRRLVFRDVPYQLFEERVAKIVLCDTVVVPPDYPKLRVAKKCVMVRKIVESSNEG